jgi:hypothetical protein
VKLTWNWLTWFQVFFCPNQNQYPNHGLGVMNLLLIILIIVLLFGSGFGYANWGYPGGLSIGGVLLVVLIIILLLGR